MSETWRTATKANLYVWDVNTLDFIPWDGSPTGGGGGTGGTVDQGSAGVSPWLVSINGVPHVVIDSASLGTVAVSVASLPLPTGAATAARQDTGNTSLASIDGKLTSPLAVTGPLTDTALRASAVPVSLATAPSTPVTNANLDSPLSGLKTDLDKIPSPGQALAAGSMPVVLPVAQVTTLTPPAAIAGFALEAGHLAAIDTHLDVALSTRLKPADTLTKVATVDTITNPVTVTAGTNLNTSALALEGGGNLAALLAALGLGATTIPGAYTVNDRLREVSAKLTNLASDKSLQQVLAAVSAKPIASSGGRTLAHIGLR